jgi:hypothetical protein
MVGEWIPPGVVVALITALGLLVVAVANAFLSVFVPRLWQDNQRRLQSEYETHIKKIDAFERTWSLATKAKEEFGIEIPTYELQKELKKLYMRL